jgi:hypothetical protein
MNKIKLFKIYCVGLIALAILISVVLIAGCGKGGGGGTTGGSSASVRLTLDSICFGGGDSSSASYKNKGFISFAADTAQSANYRNEIR